MDLRDFRLFVDQVVQEIQPGAVLNYFRTNRAYAHRRFYDVKLKSLTGQTSLKDIRKEFARTWLLMGAGVDAENAKRPKYTACVHMGKLPDHRFRALKVEEGRFNVNLRGLVDWLEGDKAVRKVIRRYKGLRMTEEQKAIRFIQCVLSRADCSQEEAMELWSSTKTATLAKLRKRPSKKR